MAMRNLETVTSGLSQENLTRARRRLRSVGGEQFFEACGKVLRDLYLMFSPNHVQSRQAFRSKARGPQKGSTAQNDLAQFVSSFLLQCFQASSQHSRLAKGLTSVQKRCWAVCVCLHERCRECRVAPFRQAFLEFLEPLICLHWVAIPRSSKNPTPPQLRLSRILPTPPAGSSDKCCVMSIQDGQLT